MASALRRRTTVFLNNLAPVVDTRDEVVRKKLICGRFPITSAGIVKMIGMALLFGALIYFAIQDQTCDNKPVLYGFFGALCVASGGQLILFLIFSFGLTVKKPEPWINGDICFNFLLSLATIITAVISLKTCHRNEMLERISECFAIAGGGITICSCVALFLMYRFIEDLEAKPPKRELKDQRKSIFT